MAHYTVTSLAVWPLLFWLPGYAALGILKVDLKDGLRAAVALLLSPVVVALWMWVGALLHVPLAAPWVIALPLVSIALIAVSWLRNPRRDVRRLLPPLDVVLVLAFSAIVTIAIPQKGLSAGIQWNDEFHTLLTQQIVRLGRIPLTMPQFMPGYRLTYPPTFHFVTAAWHLLSAAPVRILIPRTAGVFAALAPIAAYAIAYKISGRRAALWAGMFSVAFVSSGVTHGYTYGTGPMIASITVLGLTIFASLDACSWRGMLLAAISAASMVLFYPFSAVPGALWCAILVVSGLSGLLTRRHSEASAGRPAADRLRLVASAAALGSIVMAAIALPLVGLQTANTATTEGGGGSPFELLRRVASSLYLGAYESEKPGWTTTGLAVLLTLAVVWILVRRIRDSDSPAVFAFSVVGIGTYFVAYSHTLNAIGFTPNLIILYTFIPLTALAGATLSWGWERLLDAEPPLRRKAAAYVLLVVVALPFGVAGYQKANSLKELTHKYSYVQAADIAVLEWIGAHSGSSDGIVVDGLSDAGFWAPALIGRRTLFWYAGWPSLPPWGRIKPYLKDAPAAWQVSTLGAMGGDITIYGLGPKKGSPPSAYVVFGGEGPIEGEIRSDAETVHLPTGSHWLNLAYDPNLHPDQNVEVAVSTPGGGERRFKADADQVMRVYFATRAEALARARAQSSPQVLALHDFNWSKLRLSGYRYVFLGSDVVDKDHAILDREKLQKDRSLREVFSSGQAAAFEILP